MAQNEVQTDTTLAKRYYEKADTFAAAQEYDSALLYLKKAEQIYEAGLHHAQYVDCLQRKGNILNTTGQYEAGDQVLQHALALSLQHLGKSHLQTAHVYHQLGWNRFYIQKYDEALQNYSEALRLFSQLNGEIDLEVAKQYINIGNVYRRKYMPEKAIEHTLKGIDLLTTLGQDTSSYAASAYNGLGATYASMEAFDKALAYHHKALPLYLKAFGENHSNVAGSYFNIGNIYADRGDNATALDYYHKALDIDISLFGENHVYVAGDYESIGICNIQKGDAELARSFFQKSLEIAITSFGEKDVNVASLYGSIGSTYNHQKDYAQALAYYQKSLNIFIEADEYNSPHIASVYNNLGNTSLKLGHVNKALDYQQKALRIYRKLADVWQSRLGETYGFMGNCYEEVHNYPKALEYYKKDLEIRFRTVGKHHPEVAYVYGNIGNIYKKAGRFRESLFAYQQGLQVLFTPLSTEDIYQNPPIAQTLNPYILYEILNGKARALQAYAEHGEGNLNDLRFSLETYGLAANTLYETRKSLQTTASKSLLAEKSFQYFEEGMKTAWLLYEKTGEKAYINQAFMLSEKSKAAALLEAIKESEAREFAHIPPAVLDQERTLKLDLAFYRRKLFEEKQEQPDSLQMLSYQNRIFSLKNSYDSLVNVMEKEFPDYYQLKYNTEVASLMQVQQNMLNENQALLTYFMGDSSIFTFAINNNDAAFFRIQKDSTYVQDIAVARTVVADKTDDIAGFAKSAHALYNTLVAPAEPLIRKKNLIVIPDGLLGYLPFEILLTSRAEDTPSSFYQLPYLIKDYQITYAYSATLSEASLKPHPQNSSTRYLAFAPDFNQGNSSPPASSSLLAVADRERGALAKLEGTADEVNAIDKFFKGQFYEGPTASEYAFKKNAPDFDIIHLATHAIIDDEHPMNSRLLFTMQQDSLEDGNLYAWELYNMQLNAKMAVLSACNTGFGKLQRGEGVMSLGRAFAYAGCPSIVMSLWPAQDQATADIMSGFYQGLSAGMRKDEALRQAKLQYLASTEELFAHPFYWAGFVTQGDASPVHLQNNIFSFWIWGGALVLTLVLILWLFKYLK